MADGTVSTGALLRHLVHAGRGPVEIDVDLNGAYHVHVGDVFTFASTLGEAVRRACVECDGPIGVLHANQRARVRLPEGGLGTLTRVTARSRVATVRTDEGRWRHLPVRSITLLDESAITRSESISVESA